MLKVRSWPPSYSAETNTTSQWKKHLYCFVFSASHFMQLGGVQLLCILVLEMQHVVGFIQETEFETSLMSVSANSTLWKSLHSSQSLPCQLPGSMLLLIPPSTCISNYLCHQWPLQKELYYVFFTAKLSDSACSLWSMGFLEIPGVIWEAVMDQTICSINQILPMQASEKPLEKSGYGLIWQRKCRYLDFWNHCLLFLTETLLLDF